MADKYQTIIVDQVLPGILILVEGDQFTPLQAFEDPARMPASPISASRTIARCCVAPSANIASFTMEADSGRSNFLPALTRRR